MPALAYANNNNIIHSTVFRSFFSIIITIISRLFPTGPIQIKCSMEQHNMLLVQFPIVILPLWLQNRFIHSASQSVAHSDSSTETLI